MQTLKKRLEISDLNNKTLLSCGNVVLNRIYFYIVKSVFPGNTDKKRRKSEKKPSQNAVVL